MRNDNNVHAKDNFVTFCKFSDIVGHTFNDFNLNKNAFQ